MSAEQRQKLNEYMLGLREQVTHSLELFHTDRAEAANIWASIRRLKHTKHGLEEPSPLPPTYEEAEKMTPPNSVDDLEVIDGIGPAMHKRLNNGGISSFEQLAARTPDELSQILGKTTARLANVETWIAQAQNLIQ